MFSQSMVCSFNIQPLFVHLNFSVQGIPWQTSGWDSVLSLPRAMIQSLAGELRSHKPPMVLPKKKKINNKKKSLLATVRQ